MSWTVIRPTQWQIDAIVAGLDRGVNVDAIVQVGYSLMPSVGLGDVVIEPGAAPEGLGQWVAWSGSPCTASRIATMACGSIDETPR